MKNIETGEVPIHVGKGRTTTEPVTKGGLEKRKEEDGVLATTKGGTDQRLQSTNCGQYWQAKATLTTIGRYFLTKQIQNQFTDSKSAAHHERV